MAKSWDQFTRMILLLEFQGGTPALHEGTIDSTNIQHNNLWASTTFELRRLSSLREICLIRPPVRSHCCQRPQKGCPRTQPSESDPSHLLSQP